MSWWYVSCPRFSCLVELDDNNVIVGGAPIVRRFMGKPAKQLGEYMRKRGGRAHKMPAPGEVRFERVAEFDRVYAWGNNEKRETLKGRRCRIVARGAMRSVLVEFDNGQREVVSRRALRKGERSVREARTTL